MYRTTLRFLAALLGATLIFGATLAQLTVAAPPAAAATPLSAFSVGSNQPAAVYGQGVTILTLLTGTATTPTGTVDFLDGATTICSARPLQEAELTLAGATCTTAALTVGTHSITVTYSGDATYDPATTTEFGPALAQVVAASSTSTLLVVSGPNPSVFSGAATFTATVTATAPGAGTPTGNVAFKNAGIDIVGCGGALTIGQATCVTTALGLGAHSVTAVYAGTWSYLTSSAAPVTQTVSKADTTGVVLSSDSTTRWTDPVTFTATISSTAPATATATGTVSFKYGGTTIAGCGGLTVVGGAASCMTSTVPVGAQMITVAYSGDASFNLSSSPAILQTVSRAVTTTTLTSNHSPATFGQPVAFTATVTSSAGTPAGVVAFFAVRDDSTRVWIGTKTLTGGTATASTASLPVGTTTISAVYRGTTTEAPSSTTYAQSVHRGATAMTLTSSGTPSTSGQRLTFSAGVNPTAPGAGTPTGQVAFFRVRLNQTRQWIGTVELANGTATMTTSGTPVGRNTILGVYRGGTNHTASTRSMIQRVTAQ